MSNPSYDISIFGLRVISQLDNLLGLVQALHPLDGPARVEYKWKDTNSISVDIHIALQKSTTHFQTLLVRGDIEGAGSLLFLFGTSPGRATYDPAPSERMDKCTLK